MSSASAIAGACCSSLARSSSCAASTATFVGAQAATGAPSTSDLKFSGCSCANFHVVGSRSSSSSSSCSASASAGLLWEKDFLRVSSRRRRSCQWYTGTGKDSRTPAGRRLALLAAPRAAANAEKLETQTRAPIPAETEDVKIARRAADWKKAAKMKETGAVHRGRVDACNSGGLLVRIGSLQGFLPFSHLNAARLPRDGSKTISDIGNDLVGDVVSVKVIEVVEADRRLIVSEKLAALVDILQQIQEGTVYKGKVNFVTDYGAFVDLQFPDGSYPISGLVHVTELSWDPIPFPQDFIVQGQEVSVKVIQVDREKSKIALSIKQLQADPLLETLDTLMPTQDDNYSTETINSDLEVVGTPLPGLEQICDFMLQEEGISNVTLGRQALEKRVVSQDLELWLSNAIVEDGKFTLLARAGRQVQEVYLNTTLDREGIKAAVQRVTGRVP